jgi:hypothetical protein
MYLHKNNTDDSHKTDWIGILLETPVADGRHRIIEHLFAPYLINVKHLEIDKAMHIIEDWAERCEVYSPNRGNINAFIERVCYNVDRYKRKPKDLSWFKENYKSLYNMIASLGEAYGIQIE